MSICKHAVLLTLLAGTLVSSQEDSDTDISFSQQDPEQNIELVTQSYISDTYVKLNRVTFHGNVLDEGNNFVEHWIVHFCLPWYEPCQQLELVYAHLSEAWQKQLNGKLLSNEVRFAVVDCSVDKVLCNEQGGKELPVMVHYHRHKPVGSWVGENGRHWIKTLFLWLKQELGNIPGRDTPSSKEAPDSGEAGSRWFYSLPDGATDVLLVLFALAVNLRLVSTNLKLQTKGSCSMGLSCDKIRSDDGASTDAMTVVERQLLPSEWVQDRAPMEL